MPYPRPPPEYPSFDHMPALPEIKGWTMRRLSLARKAIRVRCRACGRETIVTPVGIQTIFRKRFDATIDQIVPALRCETCGGLEAQASGWTLEKDDPRLSFCRREHAGIALRRDG